MNIAEKLLQLNTNLGTIQDEVVTQEDLIAQIKTKANGLPNHLDTSDATATSADVLYKKTAYVNGKKITGEVYDWSNLSNEADEVKYDSDGISLHLTTAEDEPFMIRGGQKTILWIDHTLFGDAMAEDVAAGKTFTSSAGLKVTGTATLGSSSEPVLWGSYALKTYLLTEDFVQATYDLSGLGIRTYFWGGEEWLPLSITSIEVSPDDGFVIIFGGSEMKVCYFEDGWYDGNDEQYNHNRLLVIEVPSPSHVSQDIYSLFERIVDVDTVQPFDLGYELGTAEGGDSSEDLEALGALCDWSTMVDSTSSLVVTIRNLHPTYNMLCTLEWCYAAGGSLISEYPFTIECGEGEVSWSSGIEEGVGGSGYKANITNIRWVKA